MFEAQRPKRDLIKRSQTIALLAAFALYVINAVTGRAKGPDLAHWENWYDPDKGTETTQFAIFKLTEGTTWIDPLVDVIWQGVKKVAVRGGYHYQRSNMSWTAQVEHYLTVAARYDLHFHAVDLEEYGNTYNDTFFADTRRIIDALRSRTGKKVLLYSNISTYTQFAAAIKRLYPDGQAWLDALEFWIAYPSSTLANPPLPTGRTTWTFWQVSWTETAYGAGAPCDLNVFNGTNDALLEWAGVTQTEPPPPPTEEPMPQYKVTTIKSNMSLRYDHNTSGTKKGTVQNVGTVLLADEIWTAPSDLFNSVNVQINQKGDQWAHVISENAWIAITHLGVVYCTYMDVTPQPPAVTVTAVRVELAPGSRVTTEYSDGTAHTEVA